MHCGRKGARFSLVQAPPTESLLDSRFHVPSYNLVPSHHQSLSRSTAQSPLQSVDTSPVGMIFKLGVLGGLIGIWQGRRADHMQQKGRFALSFESSVLFHVGSFLIK